MQRLFWLALAIAACGHPASSDHPTTTATAKPAGDPTCPVLVPGTSVSVEDSKDGAAFVFVTSGDVGEVRKRAAALAVMHEKHDGPAMAMGMMVQTPSSAASSDVERGARVAFVAKPEDVAALQTEMRQHAQHLGGGTCEMAM